MRQKGIDGGVRSSGSDGKVEDMIEQNIGENLEGTVRSVNRGGDRERNI